MGQKKKVSRRASTYTKFSGNTVDETPSVSNINNASPFKVTARKSNCRSQKGLPLREL